MDKATIRNKIVGNPTNRIAGLQDDWWTEIAPDIWNSRGSYLKDVDGTEYLDLCGFFSTAPVRFDHPSLRDPSFIERMGRLSIYRPSIADFWTEELAEFIETFRKIATPAYMHHYFFIDGGSLAVENALKAAFDWKVRLNIQKGKIKNDPQEEIHPLGTKIIHFERGFHGRSGYTLSLTHTIDPRKYKYFPKFAWHRIEPPVLQFDYSGKVCNGEEVESLKNEALRNIKRVLKDSADDIAAILVEPVQCEGGDRHIPAEFFTELRNLADENDLILIYDEVQTGFGTTGRMWAHEYFGKDALPDVIAFSKKTQTGGIMANHDRFARVEGNVFGNSDPSKSRLNSTWGGNPVDMMRCAQFLRIIAEDNLIENARRVGDHMLKELGELCKMFNNLIENPRGKGLLLAFDAKKQEHKFELWKAFRNDRLLCLTCGARTLRFRPHLDITKEEADDAIGRMKAALMKIQKA